MWWRKDDNNGNNNRHHDNDDHNIKSEDDNSSSNRGGSYRTSSVPSKKSRVGNTNRSFLGGSKSLTHRRRRKGKQTTSVAETNSGFEVSLSPLTQQQQQQQQQQQLNGDKNPPSPPSPGQYPETGPQQNPHSPAQITSSSAEDILMMAAVGRMKPVMSFQDELASRQKVNRTQYSVTQFPALGSRPRSNASASNNNSSNHKKSLTSSSSQVPVLKPSRHHRVQFDKSKDNEVSSFEDCLFLLRSHEVVDEMTSLKEEIAHMNAELDALQNDKTKLEEFQQSQQETNNDSRPQSPPSILPAAAAANNANNIPTAWDVNELLSSKAITNAQRCQLQAQRGIQLTVQFHDRNATEALATRCGVKHHVMAKLKEKYNTNSHNHSHGRSQNKMTLLELTLDTCREGGAATHLQHISLLCKDGGSELGFFLGRDQGKSVYWGHLPDRLYRRMQDSGLNPRQSASELTFLATGPMDYYFAEFRSGEAWWGSAVEDQAFHSICSEWDVYRVVFGPKLVFSVGDPQQHEGGDHSSDPHTHQSSSWVILSRDGRAAWKNLPSRLDHLLQSRMANQAGLAEVSLGCGDSYFCRFLDGTVDYCLPGSVADVCQQLEARGSTITNISLHPELSHDFVIRSSNGNI